MSKCMSGKQGALKSGQGKMSSAHGTNGQSTNNNMSKNSGGYRIGADCPTFGSSNYRQAGPGKSATTHAKQPSGKKV